MRSLSKSASDNVFICITMIILTGLSIIGRFALKISKRQRPTADDWICLASVMFFYVYCVMILTFILHRSQTGSLDRAEMEILPSEVIEFLKMTYLIELFFICVLSTVKISILVFYYRIFASTKVNKLIVIGTGVACIVWFLIAIFVAIFQCVPMREYWETSVRSPKCLNAPRRLLGYEITNLILDIAILCIPVPIVWRLQLKSSKKFGVIGIFLLGGFVCIASIMRVTKIWIPPDVNANFNLAIDLAWSTIQQGVAIVCACLPTMGSLLTSIPTAFLHLSNWATSIWNRGHRIYDGNEIIRAKEQTPCSASDTEADMQCGGTSCSWAHSSGGRVYAENDAQRIPPNAIVIDRDIHVV